MSWRVFRHSLLLMLPAGLSSIAAASGLDAAFSIGSDFVVRGETRSRGEPVVQAHIGGHHDSGWSLGAMLSTVDINPGPGPSRELDVSLAKSWPLGPDWSMSGSVTHYSFAQNTPELSYDYTEIAAGASFRDRVELSVAYSPAYSDFTFRGIVREQPAVAYDALLRLPVSAGLQLHAGAGFFDLERLAGTGYWYWSAGAEVTLSRMMLALQYIDTDHTAAALLGSAGTGSRLVATFGVKLH
jgi:uncharacterized protein (TIGR02001 family)